VWRRDRAGNNTTTDEEVHMNEVTAEAAVDIDAPPVEVWTSLTDPQRIKEYYLGADVETDWEVGSPITFKGEWEGKAYDDKGEILTFEPERNLAYSHWSPMGGKPDAPEHYHVVDIALEERDGGTRVTLRQSNLQGGATEEDRSNREHYEKTWKQMLDGLKQTTEQAPAR
jgi:uncharacterized protein YndB with AHSA1/START domain